jgi:hypothetical protein
MTTRVKPEKPTPTRTQDGTEQGGTADEKLQEVRAAFADAPEVGKKGLEKVFGELTAQVKAPGTRVRSAGRAGSRQGAVSEFTIIAPFAPGGAKRLRSLLTLLNGNFEKADMVGTVHDMRFVFLDNDTKLLFATAYDGDWDAYIVDFATKIPDYLDILMCGLEGWPGIRSPEVKDYLANHQITADAWYVGNPDLTVTETRRLKKIGDALDDFLDKVGD